MGNMVEEVRIAEAEVPTCIDTPQPLSSLIAEAACKYPNSIAVNTIYQPPIPVYHKLVEPVEKNLIWTYQQLDDVADLLAAAFHARGIGKGMQIAALLSNSAEWALLFWSSLKLGAVFVPLDARSVSRQDEVRHYLTVLKPAVLVLGDDTAVQTVLLNNASELPASLLKVIASSNGPVQEGWTSLQSILHEGHRLEKRVTVIEHGQRDVMGEIILIVFTSGTSGLPKACPHTNLTLWTACQAFFPLRTFGPDDSLVQHLPPSHMFACYDMMLCWSNGATVIYPAKTFDAKATLDALERLHCTCMSVVPSMFLALTTHPSFAGRNTSSLRQVTFSGTVMSPDILAAAADPGKLGVKHLVVGYGMSEAIPGLGTDPETPLKIHSGCLGFDTILRGAKIRICEPGSHKILRRGEVGELHLGGSGVIDGYLCSDNPTFYDDPSGHWMVTGDQARMDVDGAIYIMGRYKDIIIRAGENLSPALIEASLNRAGVVTQVIGIPDDVAGELPVAIVQCRGTDPPPLLQMQAFVHKSLGPQNAPVAYLTLEDLSIQDFPTTTSGKVRKDRLKAIAIKYLSEQATTSSTDIQASLPTLDVNERLLVDAFATLTGQATETIPLDTPIANLTDSINLLRFHAHIRRLTSREVTIEDVMSSTSIRALSKHFIGAPILDHSISSQSERKGPPTTRDMVHTQGDYTQFLRTIAVTEPVLQKLGLSWSDVEDVFPIPGLSSRSFEATRPKAYSIRAAFITRSASSSSLRTALEATLQQWPMFRSLAVRLDQQALFVTMRASSRWSEAAVTEVFGLESPQALCSLLYLSDSEKTSTHPGSGGPLTRFVVADIKSTGTAGLVMTAHHSPHDAISMQAFLEDLRHNLAGTSTTELRTPYKLFADMYFQYSNSLPSQTGVAFHVNRLRGISLLRESLWPRQRCVGWHIGDDEGYTIPAFSDPTLAAVRTQIDNDGGYAGLVGIQKSTRLEDLAELRQKHKISPPVLFKAACALLNSHLTRTREILFMNSQASRQWPFLDPALAKYLPSPFNIAGNTLAVVLNRIHVHPSEMVGSFLTRLEAEQQQLTAHAHAPIASIVSQLNPGDAAAFMAGRRQLLNWNPNLAETTTTSAQDQELRVARMHGYTEVMLEWHCGMLEADLASVHVQWDGCQVGKVEVQGWLDGFVAALLWVGDRGHWESKIEGLVF